ncbi:MAG: cation:proton antiporter subunit C [Elusimicrobiota bacterium]
MADFYAIANYWAVALLLIIGVHGMLARPNLMRKLMAMNIFQVAVIVLYLTLAERTGASAPILSHGADHAAAYVNPLPHALMLTAIVVSVATTGVALALLVAIYRRYGTLDEPELLERLRAR